MSNNDFKSFLAPKPVVTSKQYSWDWKDLAKGLILAVATPALLVLQQTLEAGSLQINWREMAMVSIAAGVSYMVKNFFQKPSVTVADEAVEEIKNNNK